MSDVEDYMAAKHCTCTVTPITPTVSTVDECEEHRAEREAAEREGMLDEATFGG